VGRGSRHHYAGRPDGPPPATTIGDIVDPQAIWDRHSIVPACPGRFAVDASMALQTPADFDHLAAQALLRMALDWGYLDAHEGLEGLISDPPTY